MEMNHENVIQLQRIKFDLFLAQDPEVGQFDVTFEVDGRLLYAHKAMLNLVSPTFTSMLSERWNHNNDGTIGLQDYSYDYFYQFLIYLYSGQCQLTDTNIYEMVDIAEFYGVQLFKAYCHQYLSTMVISTQNVFPLMDLAKKYDINQLLRSVENFIENNFTAVIQSDGFLTISYSLVDELTVTHKYKATAEDIFEAVYKWCEKQANDKKSANPVLLLENTIRNEIHGFLPQFSFHKMNLKFLHEFVVPRGFIFSSLNVISRFLSERLSLHARVHITNERGQTLHGTVIPDQNIIEKIKPLNFLTCFGNSGGYSYMSCYWRTQYTLPSTPSSLKKRDDVLWYLIYEPDGDVSVRHRSIIRENDYLLAELAAGTSGFNTTVGCKIEIE